MAAYSVRAAVEADLAGINTIWYEDEIAGEEPPKAAPAPLGVYAYLLSNGAMRVASASDGALTGFGATISWPMARGSLTYLSDLFVARESQSRGVGQALMSDLMAGVGPRCVMASRDLRATALYIRAGMKPLWPNYWLNADTSALASRLAELPGADFTVTSVALDDPDLLQWDRDCCGFERAGDLRWMAQARDAEARWFMNGSERVGYAVVQRRCDESLWRPDAWTIGPVGVRAPEQAAACVGAIIRHVAPECAALRLAVPGSHPALVSLISAGFTIVYIETFLASDGGEPFDARRYLTSGLFL